MDAVELAWRKPQMKPAMLHPSHLSAENIVSQDNRVKLFAA